jgi:tetratricopeptide (TPR) repeat protein
MASPETATAAWAAYRAGDLPRAERLAREALAAEPDDARTLCLLGIVCQAGRRPAEAREHYAGAVRLKPDYAEAHNNLGVTLAQDGRREEAVESFRQAVRLIPAFAEAHNNLGNALRLVGRLDEAVVSLREAVRLAPDYADAHHNLGLALLSQNQFALAADSFAQVLRRRPDHAGVLHGLGVALLRQDKLPEAAAAFARVLRLRPDEVEALNDQGYTRRKQGRWGESLACFDRAVELQPDHAGAHHNRALLRLTLGDYERGWAEYEWRLLCPEITPPPFRIPLWDGSALAGRTILLHTEQGIGDTFQFARYAPLVKRKGGTVLLACPEKLVGILSGCAGIDRVVVKGKPIPPFDVHASLLSLPYRLGTTLDDVPAAVPYLTAEPALVEQWRQELGSLRAFKVGIFWQGSPGYREDAYRSIPLARFAPLAAVEGVRLFSLQKGQGTEQLAEVAGRFDVTDLGGRLDETTGAFVETAAVVKNLDLVVTCDSAVGHLAGALGVPVWVALPAVPDYRWMLGRPDSPWYPTVRLFRQERLGEWEEVFARMAGELRALAAARG